MRATGSIRGSDDEARRVAMSGMGWGDEFAGKKVVLTGACGIYGGWIPRAFAAAGARLLPSGHHAGGVTALSLLLCYRDGGRARAAARLTPPPPSGGLVSAAAKPR